MIDVLQSAIAEIGISEIPGTDRNNDNIMKYSKELGLSKWIPNDETPWCALFANYHLMKCGREFITSARVKDFLQSGFGLRLKHASYGCLVVLDPSHVGFFVGFSGNNVQVLGGNQRNSVNIANYPIECVKEFIYCP